VIWLRQVLRSEFRAGLAVGAAVRVAATQVPLEFDMIAVRPAACLGA
jgi:hypothetical protein